MKLRNSFLYALVVLGALSAPATAQVIHDGGQPNGAAGYDIWGDNLVADDFEATSSLSFNALRFWGVSNETLISGSTTDIFWKFFLDDGAGAPDALSPVAEGTSTATLTHRTGASWQFDSFVGAQSLSSGVYWLALNAPSISDMIWEGSNGGRGDGFAQSYTWDQTTWGSFSGSGNLAFQLHDQTSVVPEPVSMVLLGSGLAGVGAMRRKRRKEAESA